MPPEALRRDAGSLPAALRGAHDALVVEPAAEDGVTLRLKSHPRYLSVARAVVRSFGRLAGFEESRVHQIALAVDEGCANMIRHSYGGRPDGDIEITFALAVDGDGTRRLVIRLRDHGLSVDPVRVETPPASDPQEPGGLGLHLMHGACDSVRADPDIEDGNLIELTVTCPRVRASGDGD